MLALAVSATSSRASTAISEIDYCRGVWGTIVVNLNKSLENYLQICANNLLHFNQDKSLVLCNVTNLSITQFIQV